MKQLFLKFQMQVREWMLACFGRSVLLDKKERSHRFLEESLELSQTFGCTKEEAHQLVDYVFNRPVGEIEQECGGVMVTLAALCESVEIDMLECGSTELNRVWEIIDKIRNKFLNAPKDSPLPQ